MIEIKDEHIGEAEELLINGNRFDEAERVPFIKNLTSIDLLAVPGSGKTTALQAKLYCLSKHLPFDDDSGILVLSHTNAAIEEIEKNLKQHCPKLFEYPNFVGTVQSFVNKFLANNGCFLLYNSYLSIVDNDYANKRITTLTSKLPYQNSFSKYLFIQTYNQCASINKKRLIEEYEITEENSKVLIDQLKTQKVIDNGSLLYAKVKEERLIDQLPINEKAKAIIKDIHKKAKEQTGIEKNKRSSFYTIDYNNNQFFYTKPLGFNTESGKELSRIFNDNFEKGIVRYRDCYSFASWYMEKYPLIMNFLQKRFKYVFVDEMQDLEKFQIDLIDNIFFKNGSSTIIQRIGDRNQAIYNSGKKIIPEVEWQPRKECCYLTGSNRLTKEVADVVNYFTLNPQKDIDDQPRFVVNGLRKLDTVIKPHLILYDVESKYFLEDKFLEIIQSFSLHETLEGNKYGFKIIGWNAKWDDENEDRKGKLRLEDIFENYYKEANEKRESFDSLSKYLQCFDKNKKTLKYVQNNILNSLIDVLKHERKTCLTFRKGVFAEKLYTQRELMRQIKLNSDNYNFFKTKLYEWCFSLVTKKNYSEIYNSVRSFIVNEFKDWFDLSLTQECKGFLGGEFKEMIINDSDMSPDSSQDEIKVDIGTVHSAKGQTHCATMYVETSFHKYETEKLRVTIGKGKKEKKLNNPLYKQEHEYRSKEDSHAKMTMRMMYVGFSRPTHLLCFACLKENVVSDIESFKKVGWEIIDLTGRMPDS
jgi:superfamily I DNA/RNA helicase